MSFLLFDALNRAIPDNRPRTVGDLRPNAVAELSAVVGLPTNTSYPLSGGLGTLKFSDLLSEYPHPYLVVDPSPVGSDPRPNLWRARSRASSIFQYYRLALLLGECPVEGAEADCRAWMDAAGLVEIFRERWQIRDDQVALPGRGFVGDAVAYHQERKEVNQIVTEALIFMDGKSRDRGRLGLTGESLS